MKKTHIKSLTVLAVVLAGALSTQAESDDSFKSTEGMANRFYVGMGAGQSSVKLQNDARNEEGIDFVFEGTDDGDLATSFIVGMRVSRFFGIEGGAIDLGSVDQGFTFNDPRKDNSGTGMLNVAPSGFYAGALLSHDVGRCQVYLRGGILMWDYDMEIRFDIEDGDKVTSQFRDYSRDGTSTFYGAGLRYRVANHWSLGLDANFTDVDGDDLSMVGGSVLFDVASWLDAQL